MIRGAVSISNPVSARLREIAAQLQNPVALYKDAGRRVANDLRTHFRKREADSPNKLGGRRTHFWSDVREATQNPEINASGATVTIAHLAFAQKLYGGTITAKNGGALTIPIHQLAHGRRVSVFEEETGKKVFQPKGARVLMADFDGQAIAVYALATSITQRADPRALPPLDELSRGVQETGEKHLARMLARGV
jgi:hypothetical protein